MRKFITLFAIAISMTASAQSKDSVQPKVDTVYIISKGEMQVIQTIIRQNNISFNGKPLTFDDVLQFIQGMESKIYYLPRQQQNKEQPKK